MNFKCFGYCLLFSAALLFFCSTDPVNVDTNKLGSIVKTYSSNYLKIILADSLGYLATNYHNLFRINPDSPDSEGNIVSCIDVIDTPAYSFFYNDFGKKTIVFNDGIFSFDDNWYIQSAFSFSSSLSSDKFSISTDWKGQCWYLRQSDLNNYQVFRYADGTEQICADKDTKVSAQKILFAAAYDRFAVGYHNSNYETWIDFFVHDDLYTWIHIFTKTDSVHIARMFYAGSILNMIVDCQKKEIGLSKRVDKQAAFVIYPGWNVMRIDSNINFSSNYLSLTKSVAFDSANVFYRSSHETWLWDTNSYLIATANTLTQHCFRDSSVNKFNVPCFKDSSQVLFYNEPTQRFIAVK